MIKTRMMKWAGHVAQMGVTGWNAGGKETIKKGQDVGGQIILRWILERYVRGSLAGFVWLRIGTSGQLL
jgi:hypothetical protein